MQLFWVFAIILILANVLMLGLFFWDKRQAKLDGRRVPEVRLLLLSLLGAWPAAKLGQHWFRHKTRKQPFAIRLNGIVVLHVLLTGGLCLWLVSSSA